MVEYDFYPYSTAPAPYDVVWSQFPNIENPELPGPKARPALVRQAFQDQDGNAWVKVVYGTSKDPYRASVTDFSIVTLTEMNMCGLKCATRFRLDREATLPWAREFFDCLPGKPSPIIGHMPEYEVRKLQMQISYLQQKYMEWMAAREREANRAEKPESDQSED